MLSAGDAVVAADAVTVAIHKIAAGGFQGCTGPLDCKLLQIFLFIWERICWLEPILSLCYLVSH